MDCVTGEHATIQISHLHVGMRTATSSLSESARIRFGGGDFGFSGLMDLVFQLKKWSGVNAGRLNFDTGFFFNSLSSPVFLPVTNLVLKARFVFPSFLVSGAAFTAMSRRYTKFYKQA
ncbi:UNVERIFIED_CONTAM: hypothetical protein K2H54_025021 [Gekko kuhli]